MKTQITLLTAVALLSACSSVSEKSPAVRLSPQTPAVIVQNASYVASTPNTSLKDASSVCETDAMRNLVLDGNDRNDSVRIMVVQDSNGSSQLLSEQEINCRNYFLRKSVRSSEPALVPAATETSSPSTAVAETSSRYSYIVQRGDTVWNIAREHCTTVKAISRLNGLGRGNFIDIGQRLKMPVEDCS